MRTLIVSDKNDVSSADWVRILGGVKKDVLKVTSSLRDVLSILREDSIQLLVIDFRLKSMSVFNSISASGLLDLSVISIVVSNNSSNVELINRIDKRPDIIIQRPMRLSDMKVAVKRAAQTAKNTSKARECFIENNSVLAKELLFDLIKNEKFKPGGVSSDYLFNILILMETLLKTDGFESISGFIKTLYDLFKKSGNNTAAQQISNIIPFHYVSINQPEKAIDETIKLLGENPSIPSTLFALSQAYSAIGDNDRSNQMLEMIDASTQFSPSLHSIKALNHFTLENHKESVIEQMESVRWLNLEIDDEDYVFREYSLLSKYASAYLSCYEAKVDYKLISGVKDLISDYDSDSTHEWVKEQLFEIQAKTLLKQGDIKALTSFIEKAFNENRSLLIKNKTLRERIGKHVVAKMDNPKIKQFFGSFESQKGNKVRFVSENKEVALLYKEKAHHEFEQGNIDTAEEFILKARALLPDNIEINVLHVEINLFLFGNIRSYKLLEDSYKYLEKIFDSVSRNDSSYAKILNLLAKLDNLSS